MNASHKRARSLRTGGRGKSVVLARGDVGEGRSRRKQAVIVEPFYYKYPRSGHRGWSRDVATVVDKFGGRNHLDSIPQKTESSSNFDRCP